MQTADGKLLLVALALSTPRDAVPAQHLPLPWEVRRDVVVMQDCSEMSGWAPRTHLSVLPSPCVPSSPPLLHAWRNSSDGGTPKPSTLTLTSLTLHPLEDCVVRVAVTAPADPSAVTLLVQTSSGAVLAARFPTRWRSDGGDGDRAVGRPVDQGRGASLACGFPGGMPLDGSNARTAGRRRCCRHGVGRNLWDCRRQRWRAQPPQ